MALIKCPKCGKEFSDRAEKCPQCGISKDDAVVFMKKQAEVVRLEAERKAAERVRLRKEREAKEVEEARLRKEKRAKRWKKNAKWVIMGVVLLILCFFAYILYLNNDSVIASRKDEIKSMFRFREATQVVIPKGVSCISSYAFVDCSNLISITIPEGVTNIGEHAFDGCSNLTSIVIPSSVQRIGEDAFRGTNLSSVVWNAKCCSDFERNERPFYDVNTITSFTFGDEVEHIPAHLCYDMSSINKIEIPNSVKSIGDDAFYNCKGLTSVTVGNSVTFIGHEAFQSCPIKSIVIPSSVQHIGEDAFVHCCRLTEYIVAAENLNYCSIDGVLFNKDRTKFISCPSGKQGKIIIPNSVYSIGRNAFYGCSGLTSITIPNSVTTIGGYAFHGCSGLISMEIPNSVRCIGELAFCNCTSLTSITIPNSVTSLDNLALAFGDCTKLSVKVPQRFRGNYVSCKNVTYY